MPLDQVRPTGPGPTPTPDPSQVLPSSQEHVQQARKTRIRYDNVRRTAITMMRGWDDGRGGGGRSGGRGRPEYDED